MGIGLWWQKFRDKGSLISATGTSTPMLSPPERCVGLQNSELKLEREGGGGGGDKREQRFYSNINKEREGKPMDRGREALRKPEQWQEIGWL
jgi:hypothetical protein